MITWALFLTVALVYASVGFGGGSSYISILVLSKEPIQFIPIVALLCNVIVVTGGAVHSIKTGKVQFREAMPFFALSVPMAFIGGTIKTSDAVLIGTLSASLFVGGLLLITESLRRKEEPAYLSISNLQASIIGGGIGFLAGFVGIGGGIFLSPILNLKRWGNSHKIAGICTLFILVNSISGLVAQLLKQKDHAPVLAYWPLFAAVLLGGQIGSLCSTRWLNRRIIIGITGLLTLFASLQLAKAFLGE